MKILIGSIRRLFKFLSFVEILNQSSISTFFFYRILIKIILYETPVNEMAFDAITHGVASFRYTFIAIVARDKLDRINI